ncbi:MAG: molybdopterin-dependent oxidoreductase [Pseudomonadota bacterium]
MNQRPATKKERRVVRTLCSGCHCACGVLAHVEEGQVVKVEGDPDFPANEGSLCPKGLSAVQFLYHPDRLLQPLQRTGGRGEGRWRRLPMDEALDITAARFTEIRDKYGPAAIGCSWGDASYHSCFWSKQAWLKVMGSPTHFHSDAHYCFHPLLIANRATFGHFSSGESGVDYRNSKCIVLWGGNPVMSHPTRARDIMIGVKNGAKLVVVDPRFTQIAAKADLFLQVRPGTDDALALGMLWVIINEKLYDQGFVSEWCLGFDELRERVQEYPVSRTAEITGLEVEDIVKAARMYATIKPSIHHCRMGVQQNSNVVQTCRAISIMIAICGNLDVKGGHVGSNFPPGFKPILGLYESREALKLPQEIEETRIGARNFPLMAGPESLSGGFTHPPSVVHAILTGQPYPVKANWFMNDLAVCFEGQREVHEAIRKLEFTVGSDFFMTPTMELCDIILPPTMWLEKDGLEEVFYNTGHKCFVAARQKVVEPLGETMDDSKMDLEIIKRMGLDHLLPWKSAEDFFNFQLAGTGVTFAELKKTGFIEGAIEYKQYEKTGFDTPSGKVELRSSILEKHGYDPLPYYAENELTPVSTPELLKDYPLNLITGGRHIAYFHSNNRQIPWCRELEPMPRLEIHPETAEKLGLQEKDWAWIETPKWQEKVRMQVQLTRAVRRDVVHAPSHWWFPEIKTPDHGCFQSSINLILSNDPPYDPVSGATNLRGVLCRVSKAREE